jgi:hypothetical protein
MPTVPQTPAQHHYAEAERTLALLGSIGATEEEATREAIRVPARRYARLRRCWRGGIPYRSGGPLLCHRPGPDEHHAGSVQRVGAVWRRQPRHRGDPYCDPGVRPADGGARRIGWPCGK